MPEMLFIRAARMQPVERTPVWFMRQAGRVLPEYRAIRERYTLLEICRQPEVGVEVTLQPIRRFDVDAAVMFADIMLPLLGAGIDLELVDNVGPVIRSPISTADEVKRLRPLNPDDDVAYVLETVRLLKRELAGRIPVIGFSGAPFTLAAYLIEGKPSRDFARTKAMMFGAPDVWHALMAWVTDVVIRYLRAKIAAGVDAVQLFDSWVGTLAPDDYLQYVQPYTRQIFSAVTSAAVPLIHFGTGTATLLEHMKDDGASIIGLDWRIPLDVAWDTVGQHLGVQGNLDPAVLLGSRSVIRDRVGDVLTRAAGRPGHIFNLGHGLLPQTALENVQFCVECVRSFVLEGRRPTVAAEQYSLA